MGIAVVVADLAICAHIMKPSLGDEDDPLAVQIGAAPGALHVFQWNYF
jgi:hypothetical protein